MKKTISIVTTFRNEELVIPEFVRRIQSVMALLEQYEFELLFVDDDSSDDSLRVLEELRKNDARIKILLTSRRFGVYACLIAGLEHASGDAVIYIETDLQDPPELIPRLLEKWESGADVVYTTRTQRLGENRIKMLFTSLAYKIIDFASEVPIPINSGDYKLLSRRVAEKVVAIAEPQPYFRGMVSWVGFKQSQIFYKRDPRVRGKSHFGMFSSGPIFNFLSGILSFSMKPLYFVATTALLLAVSCAFSFVYAFWGNNPRFFFSILLVNLSFVQISIGIGALYLVRLYTISRKRPLYLLRDKIGFSDQTRHGSCRDE